MWVCLILLVDILNLLIKSFVDVHAWGVDTACFCHQLIAMSSIILDQNNSLLSSFTRGWLTRLAEQLSTSLSWGGNYRKRLWKGSDVHEHHSWCVKRVRVVTLIYLSLPGWLYEACQRRLCGALKTTTFKDFSNKIAVYRLKTDGKEEDVYLSRVQLYCYV